MINDELDIAAYTLTWKNDNPVVEPISSSDLEGLPEYITDTINIGSVCMFDGKLYGASEELLLSDSEPMWRK